ncbi:FIG00643354: hypothetical protein [Cronobacter universalis NCTC 9529]|nr:FIG00643354: hypothetical protein [Cronobacter universalis NCTC 9529]
MTQHHFRRENDRARVHFVLACVFRRGAVGRFEQRALVADVRARRDADAANLRRQGVRDVVAVQVHTGDNVIFRRTQQDLLQEGVGNHVFHNDLFTVVRVLDFHPRAAVDKLAAKLFTRQLVAPVFKRAFGEFHDVAFVHQGHGFAIVGDGVFNRRAHQAFGAFFRTRLDADAAMFREADFLHAHLFTQEFDHFLSVSGVGFPLDTGVDVFGVFTEDNHVGQFRMFNRARGALVVTYRAQADVKVQLLTQGNVEGANTAANRRGQRAFNSNAIFTNQIQGFLGQPDILAIKLGRFLTGVNFHPGNFTLAFVGFLNRGVDHFQHRRRHVHADTVAFNERDDRVVGDIQLAVLRCDLFTFRRNYYFAFHSPLLRALLVVTHFVNDL